jgi:RHS repeat-associated protein
MDDEQRIALVEMRTLDRSRTDRAPARLIRHQYGNHLGSACLELDDEAETISYEEYTPYGNTTYQAVRSHGESAKRYRYTAKERDEESGLYYHGARYYAPWIGRWAQCDPLYLKDATNVYIYALNNPVIAKDPTGGPVWLIPVVIYLGWRALESAAETGVEAGIAKATGDKDFSAGGTFVKNMAVNTVVGLIPGAVEAKLTTKAAIYTAKLAVRTGGDATYDTLRGKGTLSENLIKSGVGNVGGDLVAGGVKKLGGAVVKKFTKSADEVSEAATQGTTHTASKEAADTAKQVSESAPKVEKAVAAAVPDAPVAKPIASTDEAFANLIDNNAFSADAAVVDRLSRARQFDIGGYKSLTSKGAYGRVGDNLDSDEALQNAFVRDRRNVSRYDKLLEDNPAIALDPSLHRQVSNLTTPQLQSVSASQALDRHIDQLKPFTPDYVWRTLERESRQYITKNAL